MSRPAEPKPREVPNNIEAEQALLGAVLMNNTAYSTVANFLQPDHFYEPLHQKIFDAVGGLIVAGRIASTVTVKTFLNGEKVGNLSISEYLASLITNAVTVINAKDYGTVIYDLALRRAMIDIGTEMVNTAYDAGYEETPQKMIDFASDRLFKVSEDSKIASGFRSFRGSAIINGYLNFIGRDAAGNTRKSGVPIGLRELGTVLSEKFFEERNLYGLLSSSGEGKTSLTLQLMLEAALAGHPTALFSFDQTGEQIIAQMIAQQTSIEMRVQKSGAMNSGQFDTALGWASRISQLPLEVIDCDSTRDDPGRLAMKANAFLKQTRNGKTPFLLFDHMGTIPPFFADRRSDEGTKARNNGQALKNLMKSTGSAGLVLQQRSGGGMKRLNPRPLPGDLFGGETARQPFDAIAYLFRPEEHKRRQVDTAADDKEKAKIEERFHKMVPSGIQGENTAEIGTLKVRFGRVGLKRYVRFVGELTKYESFDHLDAREEPEMF